MAFLTLEFYNAIDDTQFDVAKQIVADRVIDKIINVQLLNNKLQFKFVSTKKLRRIKQ